ncbi:hypothetical protein N646_0927 [Vibrio alginolyticus NBRC 15630 = ATCC 17749]|uniref:Uncharacterized protein n=1 Tax=Vibrio alginolyticus (strain ATCC 17749 / DSM 2171 / NBRC 15630 / NCIMB 1903 / NCTC 12160 / XII-53) TaxID=1219076 RepID=A0A2I3C6P9_VIBAX|nr:hypothetical protein N646_0927 [Vibrio alginolyticus NBRC 15630 = ATCC 17749]
MQPSRFHSTENIPFFLQAHNALLRGEQRITEAEANHLNH